MSKFSNVLDNAFPEANLSPQQMEVVKWYVRGFRVVEISSKMGLGIDAVRLYLRNASKKIGIPWHQLPKTAIKRAENAN
jgi:DNA-binding CsgD family transcriptional regulator